MPLANSGSCDAFWSNVKHLREKFKSEGAGDKEANERAIAAASRISRENGGKPSDCLNKG